MRREQYQTLKNWKEKKNKKPMIIFGARQVGKTYLVQEFAKDNYEYFYTINFEFEKEALNIFSGNLDIKTLLIQLSSYQPNVPIIEGKTLIFFDEVQKCPQVLTALKSFALDGRFDVIASGSMLGIIMHEVSSYPVGYVETMHMKPMSFKEFLWANGYVDEQIETYKEYFLEQKPLPDGLHHTLNKYFLYYVVVGGMPEAVRTFVQTSNIHDVVVVQKRIIADYENDIAKYASKAMKEKARECFKSIPDQLAKDNKKFQYKVVKVNGTARGYGNSIGWITDAGLGMKVNRLKIFDIPLRAYQDPNAFKFYFMDTGLLLAFYEENVSFEIINGNMGVFKGGIFENAIAQCLITNGLNLYYFQKSDYLEVDFVTWLHSQIVPIEVKSGNNTKAKSLKAVVEQNQLDYGIVLSMNPLNCTNEKIKFFPLYMVMFLQNNDE